LRQNTGRILAKSIIRKDARRDLAPSAVRTIVSPRLPEATAMRQFHAVLLAAVCLLPAAAAVAAGGTTSTAALDQSIHGAQRSPKFVGRDSARHPAEVLTFFGVRPDATVVEVWPGGGYWSEILAPYLRTSGTYYVAVPSAADSEKEAAFFRHRVAAEPALFSHLTVTELGAGHTDIAPPASADVVLTFRNLHNWMYDGNADEMFAAFYRALKPGGILGIEEHRGRTDKPQDPKAEDGYVRQDYTIALAKKAGFELVGSSEVNANPKDTKEWPKGVWTLPPTFALGDTDRAKYAAIGEADNFELKFRKPEK
jgi:predicted methyltransferase